MSKNSQFLNPKPLSVGLWIPELGDIGILGSIDLFARPMTYKEGLPTPRKHSILALRDGREVYLDSGSCVLIPTRSQEEDCAVQRVFGQVEDHTGTRTDYHVLRHLEHVTC